jgi:hypothetical protein
MSAAPYYSFHSSDDFLRYDFSLRQGIERDVLEHIRTFFWVRVPQVEYARLSNFQATSKREKGKMKTTVNGRFVITVLAIACLTTPVLSVTPIMSGSTAGRPTYARALVITRHI